MFHVDRVQMHLTIAVCSKDFILSQHDRKETYSFVMVAEPIRSETWCFSAQCVYYETVLLIAALAAGGWGLPRLNGAHRRAELSHRARCLRRQERS